MRRAPRAAASPVVYASSAAVYGDNGVAPLDEEAPARRSRPTAPTSSAASCMAGSPGMSTAVPTFGLRFFNVYGPRQDPRSPYSGVISIFCDRAARGAASRSTATGSSSRDFVFVADVVPLPAGRDDRGRRRSRVFNVCTGRSTAIVDLARRSARRGAEPAIAHKPPRAGDIRASLGNPDAAARRSA